MRVMISGASGLVGTALRPALEAAGHEVVRLVRRPPPLGAGEVHWDPAGGHIDAAGLAGVDAVIHLAGENVGGGYWTAARKRRIVESREKGTTLLAEAIAGAAPPPKVLISASAVGYYGDRGDEVLTEEASRGGGFLADVCGRWEAATKAAEDAGVRVVKARLGVVLDRRGGALGKMYLPFFMGVGGVIGDGGQYFPWVSLPDVVAAMVFLLGADDVAGPVNLVAPEAVTNRAFTKALGKAMGRPTVLPLPAFVARTVFGEMGREMLLAGQRVEPAKLKAAGFVWGHPTIDAGLAAALAAG